MVMLIESGLQPQLHSNAILELALHSRIVRVTSSPCPVASYRSSEPYAVRPNNLNGQEHAALLQSDSPEPRRFSPPISWGVHSYSSRRNRLFFPLSPRSTHLVSTFNMSGAAAMPMPLPADVDRAASLYAAFWVPVPFLAAMVAARFYVRYNMRNIGLDDWGMLFAYVSRTTMSPYGDLAKT
jgi:hypothetical protein